MMQPTKHVIIEFAGMPKSGKTTILDTLSHYLRRSGVPISEFHGGGRYAPIGKDQLGRLNLYLACEVAKYCLATSQIGLSPRVHLLDRGIVDRTIFTHALRALNQVTTEHRESIECMLACPELHRSVDVCLVFTTTAQLSLEREHRNKLTHHGGRVMNTTLLEQLKTSSEVVVTGQIRPPAAAKVLHVDTCASDGLVFDTARDVVSELVPVLMQAGIDISVPEEVRS